MAPPPAPDVYEASLMATWRGEDYTNVFHFLATAGAALDLTIATGIKTGLQGAFTATGGWMANADTDLSISAVRVRDLDTGGAEFVVPYPQSGGSAITVEDPAMACLVSWGANLVGRRNHGRTYFGALSSANVTEGFWNSTVTAAIGVTAAALLTYFDGSANTYPRFGIYHRDLGTITGITSGLVEAALAHQRRRG